MFADRLEIVAAVVATLWLVLVVATVVARRLPVPRLLVRTDVLVAGGATVLLFGAGAALADHVDDAGNGATASDAAVWTFAVEHRDAAGTAISSALRVGGGTVALCVLTAAAALLLVVRGRRLDAALVVTTPLVGTLLTDALKLGYGRPRPPAAEQLIPETGFSLPSGHAVDATVVVGVLALVLVVRTVSRWRRAAIVALATVTIAAAGVGRIYLGVHWATDVVTGWLLGAAWVALCTVVLLAVEGHGTRSTSSHLSRSPRRARDIDAGAIASATTTGSLRRRRRLPPAASHQATSSTPGRGPGRTVRPWWAHAATTARSTSAPLV
jgi:membrane-associated phospholipid phosphatase